MKIHPRSGPCRPAARARNLLLRLCAGILLLSAPLAVPAAPDTNTVPDLCYTGLVRTTPRVLRIHVVEARLAPGALSLRTIAAPDPDGPGPAEAAMTSPVAMAKAAGAVAAINANVASRILPPGTHGPYAPWTNGMPVTIGGWARCGGTNHSGPDSYHVPVWIGADGRVHPGDTNVPPDAPEAAAGFTVILRDGQVVRPAGARAAALHPRSAIGADATGRRVWLVVVDGRRPGYSEGMTEAEMGGLLKEFGATDAVNLAGGGSSILLYRAGAGALKVMNRPSEGRPRPVPVLLGLFRDAAPAR